MLLEEIAGETKFTERSASNCMETLNIETKPGDDIFFEELSKFKPVQILQIEKSKRPSKSNKSGEVKKKEIEPTNQTVKKSNTMKEPHLENFKTSPPSEKAMRENECQTEKEVLVQQEHLNEIDQQYFGSINSEDVSKDLSRPVSTSVQGPEEYSKTFEENSNFIDQQYFSAVEKPNKPTDSKFIDRSELSGK